MPFYIFINSIKVINFWNLCENILGFTRKATEARELAEDFKCELQKTHPLEANVLVPNCIYRLGCPEFKPCGLYDEFYTWCFENREKSVGDMTIQERYDLYNIFYNMKAGD